MASWSSSYDIVFEGPAEEFKSFNKVIAEKLKALKKSRILGNSWDWDWLEQYNPKTHKTCAFETGLSDVTEMEEYLKELMEQFPAIGVSGEVSLCCMTADDDSLEYRLRSECGSRDFSMWEHKT